jgi:hypothetical protein
MTASHGVLKTITLCLRPNTAIGWYKDYAIYKYFCSFRMFVLYVENN